MSARSAQVEVGTLRAALCRARAPFTTSSGRSVVNHCSFSFLAAERVSFLPLAPATPAAASAGALPAAVHRPPSVVRTGRCDVRDLDVWLWVDAVELATAVVRDAAQVQQALQAVLFPKVGGGVAILPACFCPPHFSVSSYSPAYALARFCFRVVVWKTGTPTQHCRIVHPSALPRCTHRSRWPLRTVRPNWRRVRRRRVSAWKATPLYSMLW